MSDSILSELVTTDYILEGLFTIDVHAYICAFKGLVLLVCVLITLYNMCLSCVSCPNNKLMFDYVMSALSYIMYTTCFNKRQRRFCVWYLSTTISPTPVSTVLDIHVKGRWELLDACTPSNDAGSIGNMVVKASHNRRQ